MAPMPISYTEVKEVLSPTGFFKTGEKLVPSQSLGHNNMTGIAPDHFTCDVTPMDHVRMVAGSDGFWDMLVSTENGTAKELAEHAHRQWLKKWDYQWQGRMHKNDFGGSIDDVSVAVYDDKIKEYNKDYYLKRRAEILEKAKTRVICECGCDVQLSNMNAHKKTKKHLKRVGTVVSHAD
jgi:serine/threonine protein phosphatase PrpC